MVIGMDTTTVRAEWATAPSTMVGIELVSTTALVDARTTTTTTVLLACESMFQGSDLNSSKRN